MKKKLMKLETRPKIYFSADRDYVRDFCRNCSEFLHFEKSMTYRLLGPQIIAYSRSALKFSVFFFYKSSSVTTYQLLRPRSVSSRLKNQQKQEFKVKIPRAFRLNSFNLVIH